MGRLPAEYANMDADARGQVKIELGFSATAARIVPPRQFGSDVIVIADLLPETARTVR